MVELKSKKGLDIVIVTGMSGAGKTVAMQSFEDLGYFCVDNMPPALLPKFWKIIQDDDSVTKIALIFNIRSHANYNEIVNMLSEIDDSRSVHTEMLFLDASDETLVKRYKETRHKHPLAQEGRLLDGIQKERHLMAGIKSRAQLVIDTSDINSRQLRERIFENFKDSEFTTFHIEVMSFGFKYGLPIDADNVIDVRFLPNPFYVPELKPLTGLDKPVYDYVMDKEDTQAFYPKLLSLMETMIPGYQKEDKTSVTIAIGCTGGQHRSVAVAERLGHDLGKKYPVDITHRDVKRHSKA